MKKQTIIIPIALLGFGLAACNKSPQSAPDTAQPNISVEAKLQAAYGFAVQAPSSSEGYLAIYQLGTLWHDFKNSKTLAAIRANPLLNGLGKQDAVKTAIKQFIARPEAAKWLGIVKEALGSEAFVVFSPGSAEKLAVLMRLNDEMRVSQMKSAMAGGKSEKVSDNLMAIMPYLRTIDFPPMIVGFKISSQKSVLVAELESCEKNLPPGVDFSTFNLIGNQSFKSIAVTLGKVLPPAQQDALKAQVNKTISDPKVADETFQALLARHVEFAYGFRGDYFVVSIGPDHSHLKFAAGYGDSLLARPEMKVAANYSNKRLVAFSWTSADLVAACQQKFALMPYYERLKTEITHSLAAADVEKLESDLKRLDDKAKAAFTHDFLPMVGVSYRENGLRSECFGGVKTPAAGQSITFSGVPADSTFFWMDQQSNPVSNAAFRSWFDDFVATAYDTFQRLAIPLLSDQQRAQFAMAQSQAVPKLVELYHITCDQFAMALGNENAIAVDLNGEMPATPLIPTPIHDAGRMLRIAYLSDVKDPALLAESWASYLKLIREVAQMVPQAALLPGGIPEPDKETVDGVTLSYYKPPIPTGDLLPNVATTGKTFTISTSRSYSLEISKAAAKPIPPAKPLTLDVRVNLEPAFDFADKWMTLAAQYPDLFFQRNPANGEKFKKSEPDLAALVRSLRSFEGFDVQVSEENGLRRVSSAIRWRDK